MYVTRAKGGLLYAHCSSATTLRREHCSRESCASCCVLLRLLVAGGAAVSYPHFDLKVYMSLQEDKLFCDKLTKSTIVGADGPLITAQTVRMAFYAGLLDPRLRIVVF